MKAKTKRRKIKRPVAVARPEALPADAASWPVKVSCGVGVNSVAMLVGLKNRGERVDAVVFADTGAEHPETYAYIPILREWLRKVGFPDLTIVRHVAPIAKDASLYDECHRKSMLPSLAYPGRGKHSCSIKWKVTPAMKWANTWAPALEAWARDAFIWNLVGYDAGKADLRRAKRGRTVWPEGHWNRYPLIEWGWDREHCIKVIEAEGIPVPRKSACFMCPASKAHEIETLAVEHPELIAKATELETRFVAKAGGKDKLRRVKGLGLGLGDFASWTEHLAAIKAGGTDTHKCADGCGGCPFADGFDFGNDNEPDLFDRAA